MDVVGVVLLAIAAGGFGALVASVVITAVDEYRYGCDDVYGRCRNHPWPK